MCLGISMTIVTGCYVLINIAYIAVLGKDGILESAAVALVFYSNLSMFIYIYKNRNVYIFEILQCMRALCQGEIKIEEYATFTLLEY